jgi:uridine kinase
MKKINVNAINRKVAEQGAFAEEVDRKFNKKLRQAAERIADEKNERPIILLSGPSGSGKTTSALKINEMLEQLGLHAHTISMDNYFLPAGQFEQLVDENGKPDYESPYRIDIKKLGEHMELISRCEEVTVPRFHFSTQSCTDGYKLKRGKDDIIVFEGIHALNPEVTGSAGDFARCMYVSVRTRTELADGTLVHPSLIRLMRRLIRDENFRGRTPSETLDMFDSVERGENRYIMPFKYRSEEDRGFSIDTFIAYEPSIYKNFLLEKIRKESKTYPDFQRFEPMLRLLEEVDPLPPEAVSDDSLVKEFIGGSRYKY